MLMINSLKRKKIRKLINRLLQNSIWLLKSRFLASLSSNFSTICLHMLSKFDDKSAQKSSIFSTKASFERSLMNCWNCAAPLDFLGKLSFRAVCDTCHSSLHCCRNCVYYKSGHPNDCMVPNTEYIADRTTNNFCEEFKLLGKPPVKGMDPKQRFNQLFGDD